MLKFKNIIILLISLFLIFTIGCISNNNTYAASKTNISKAKVIYTKVPSKVYTYNGKNRKPAIDIKLKGVILKKGKDYTLSYKNNKNVGDSTITIKGKGKYEGKIKTTFKIIPNGTSLKKLKSDVKAFTVTWNKNTKQTTGYEIQYATDSKFTQNAKIVKVKNNKTTSKKISGLQENQKYYVRIRTYKTIKGATYYSKWSGKKAVEVIQEYPNYVSMVPYGSVHLTVGDSVQLSVKTYPENVKNNSGVWASSDESVAMVDSQGKVTGIKNGACEITFTSEKGLKATAYIKVLYTILGTKQINKVIYNNNNIKVTAKYLDYDTEVYTKLLFDITNDTENIISLHAYSGSGDNYISNSGWIINGKSIDSDYINPCFASTIFPGETMSSSMYMKQDALRVLRIKQISSIKFRIGIFKSSGGLLGLSDFITLNL